MVNRGLERVIDLYSRALSARHQVTVIQAGPVNRGLGYRQLRLRPTRVMPQIAPQNIFDKLRFRLELDPNTLAIRHFTTAALAKIHSLHPDVVVAGDGAPQIRLLKRALPQLKVVAFGAAGMGHHDRATLRARPDLFIALTNAGKSWAEPHAHPLTRLTVIPNPVELSRSKKAIPLSLPHPRVLTVGALSRYKHIVEVTAALSNLPLSHLILGDGEEAGELQRVLSARAHDFLWVKAVDPVELPAYYAAADAFCFTPDPREAFGNVYLEAMAAGLPIVATDDPIRREIIGTQGFFVAPDDPQAIRTAVVAALEHGRVDYRSLLARYRLSTVTKQLEEAIHALI